MSYLEFRNVKKSFSGTDVIRDVNLAIDQGELIVFVGPSGCGKSTLLRMLSGLETLSGGEIELDGAILNTVEAAKRGVAMVFQSYALYPHMSVLENMGFSLRVNHVSKAERTKKVKEAAKILQLDALLDRKPSELSGGQKQRVAIGRAIVRQPKIFLFDEPLSNLDAELRVSMRAEILNLHEKFKSTMIYVTHDQVEAMTLADRIVVLKDGNVQQFDTPLNLYDDPDNQFVAGFIGSPKMNFLKAQILQRTDKKVELKFEGEDKPITLNSTAALPTSGPITLGIRPDHFKLATDKKSAPFIAARYEYVEEMGGMSYLHLTTKNGTKLIATRYGERSASKDLDKLWFDEADVYFFTPSGQRLR